MRAVSSEGAMGFPAEHKWPKASQRERINRCYQPVC